MFKKADNNNCYDLIEAYDTFIFDVWGVLYDEYSLLPNVKQVLTDIEASNKRYYLLSNSPRRAATVAANLAKSGLVIDTNKIISSGDFFLSDANSPSPKLYGYEGLGYLYGAEMNLDMTDNFTRRTTDDANAANYFVFLKFRNEDESDSDSIAFLEEAATRKQIFICPNPDTIVMSGTMKRYCQGYYAKIYEDMGGKVIRYGKPHKPIYDYLFNKFDITETSKALMIGDSLSTDVSGAIASNIDSLLLLTGIHKYETDIAKLINSHTTKPSYILKDLSYSNAIQFP